MARTYLAAGIMSGTSLDGIDVTLIRTDGEFSVERLASHVVDFSPDFKGRLWKAAKGDAPLTDVLRLEKEFTEKTVQALNELLTKPEAKKAGKPDVVGFHGQTLRHLPDEGITFQMGDSSLLAEKTALPIVADFRRRDMAAGGQGAPLASYYHAALLANHKGPHVVVNLGGVANVTYITPDGEMVAGDVGPGNGLLDIWIQRHFDQPYDKDGQISLKGQVDSAWVEKTLKNTAFFNKPLPKSADRYDFDGCVPAHLSPEDGAATLAALTTQATAKAVEGLLPAEPKIWLTGGGVKNGAMVKNLKEKFTYVSPFNDIGVPADRLEAECFAWLAVRRLLNLPTSGPQSTGAKRETTGGVLTACNLFRN